jgi:hypothetical protein
VPAINDVKLVMVITRHGARACLDPKLFPWDQNQWNGFTGGELTPSGMRMLYMLGKELRRRYVLTGVLPPDFDQDEVLGFSSSYFRTNMSCHSLLTGLYPYTAKVVMLNLLPPFKISDPSTTHLGAHPLEGNRQPFPVFTFDRKLDTIFKQRNICPKISKHELKAKQNKDFVEQEAKWRKEFFPAVSGALNVPCNSIYEADAICDSIQCNLAQNNDIP